MLPQRREGDDNANNRQGLPLGPDGAVHAAPGQAGFGEKPVGSLSNEETVEFRVSNQDVTPFVPCLCAIAPYPVELGLRGSAVVAQGDQAVGDSDW